VTDLHLGAESLTQDVDDRRAVVGEHLGRTSAHDACSFGVGPDDRDGLRAGGRQRKQRRGDILTASAHGLVPKQNDGSDRRLSGQFAVLG
jgi:hypothetical protein